MELVEAKSRLEPGENAGQVPDSLFSRGIGLRGLMSDRRLAPALPRRFTRGEE